MSTSKGYKMKDLAKLFLFFSVAAIALLLISSCSDQNAPGNIPTALSPTTTPTLTPTLQGTPASGGGINIPGLSNIATAIPTLVDLVPTRTPVPTTTPDAISEAISNLIQRSGVSGRTLLWLRYADWVNLGISLFYVFVGYVVGTWLIRWLLPRLVQRTKTKLDDRLLQVSGNQLRWLAVVVIFQSSIDRLTFVGAGIKSFITDFSFFLSLFLVIGILWRLINLAAREAEIRAIRSGQQREAESLITLSVWALRFLLLILMITFALGHYAVNITGLTLFLGIIVLVFSFASRDLLADLISGAMILVDRPYRIGDRLELPSMDSWGDVVEIGMRSTKILSMENRMLVLPNSQIGKSEVINYSYPDPSYLDILNVLVAYDNDVEQVQQLLTEAIQSVEGVQKEREIYTLLMELNETHMLFWAGWWVASYQDRYPVHSEVSKAIIQKFKEAGVVLPYRRTLLNPTVDPDSDRKAPTENTQE